MKDVFCGKDESQKNPCRPSKNLILVDRVEAISFENAKGHRINTFFKSTFKDNGGIYRNFLKKQRLTILEKATKIL